MKLLLDTHILLWALTDSARLGRGFREKIADPANDAFVSAATVWEISIKKRLGKLAVPDNIVEFMAAADFASLPITFAHAMAAGALPLHHSDPFDRMLIAQAREENLVLVTCDQRFEAYQVQLLKS